MARALKKKEDRFLLFEGGLVRLVGMARAGGSTTGQMRAQEAVHRIFGTTQEV